MLRDFKYIVKRILIGTGIALLLSFLRGNLLLGVNAQVYAESVGSYDTYLGNASTGIDYNLPTARYVGLGNGQVMFNFGINKEGVGNNASASTSPIVLLRSVFISNGVANYPCDFASYSSQNSTWQGMSVSVVCPFNANNNGLVSIHLRFAPISLSSGDSVYHFYLNAPSSFQTEGNVSVQVDNTPITNAINTQAQNDLNNTNRIISSQDNTTSAINDVNDTLKDDNIDSANNQASSFFGNFQSDSHGLSGIVSAPLRLITSLSSSSCSSLVLPLPFVNQNAVLPCMSTIYNQFSTFFNLWQLITTGIIAYYILLRLFAKVHDLQNPNNDRIEVLNL